MSPVSKEGNWDDCDEKRSISLQEKSTILSKDGFAAILPGRTASELEELIDIGFEFEDIFCWENTKHIYEELLYNEPNLIIHKSCIQDTLCNITFEDTISYLHLDYMWALLPSNACFSSDYELLLKDVLKDQARLRMTICPSSRKGARDYAWWTYRAFRHFMATCNVVDIDHKLYKDTFVVANSYFNNMDQLNYNNNSPKSPIIKKTHPHISFAMFLYVNFIVGEQITPSELLNGHIKCPQDYYVQFNNLTSQMYQASSDKNCQTMFTSWCDISYADEESDNGMKQLCEFIIESEDIVCK